VDTTSVGATTDIINDFLYRLELQLT